MQLKIFSDHYELSFQCARSMLAQLVEKPKSVFCLASGHTPTLAYRLFTTMVKSEKIDTSQCVLVGLDEWLGIPPVNIGSCHYFLQRNFIQPLALAPHQFKLFNALTSDTSRECREMDEFIAGHGGIDLIVVGIGMNGHIGFNEPGVDARLRCHVAPLAEKTREVGQKYFDGKTELKEGITLGLKNFHESGNAIMLAFGVHKAEIARNTMSLPISEDVPSTHIRNHPNGLLMLDRAAAKLLER